MGQETFGGSVADSSRAVLVSDQNIPETAVLIDEKQVSISTCQTIGEQITKPNEEENTNENYVTNTQGDAVQSDSTATPHIKLEKPTFVNNVDELKLYQ